ncbi:MAG: DUF4342 domain-containing protein [Ignavibacteriales bacterium]|nr:DUF4342 domain-containing protein [Ignavibacteriales bacterium]
MSTEFKIDGKELLKKIEEIIHEGNIRRIIIKDSKGKIYLEIPLTVGVIGFLAAPVMAAVGAIAGLISKFRIEVIRKDDSDVVEFTEVKDDKEE